MGAGDDDADAFAELGLEVPLPPAPLFLAFLCFLYLTLYML